MIDDEDKPSHREESSQEDDFFSDVPSNVPPPRIPYDTVFNNDDLEEFLDRITVPAPTIPSESLATMEIIEENEEQAVTEDLNIDFDDDDEEIIQHAAMEAHQQKKEDVPVATSIESPSARHHVPRKEYNRNELEKLIVQHVHDTTFRPEEGDTIPLRHAIIKDDLRGVGLELFQFHDCHFKNTKLDRRGIEVLSDHILNKEVMIEEINLSSANLSSRIAHKPDLGLNVMLRFSLQNLPLQKTDFHHCNLQNASLKGSDLRGANFTDALLESANFRDTDLTGAIFSYASLYHTNFAGANLKGADFRNSEGLRASQIADALNVEDALFTNLDILKEVDEIRAGKETFTFKGIIFMLKNFLFEERSSEESSTTHKTV